MSFRDFRQGCGWSWAKPYERTGYETTLKSSNRKWLLYVLSRSASVLSQKFADKVFPSRVAVP